MINFWFIVEKRKYSSVIRLSKIVLLSDFKLYASYDSKNRKSNFFGRRTEFFHGGKKLGGRESGNQTNL